MLQNLQPRPKLLIFNYPHNPSAPITVEASFWAKVVKDAGEEVRGAGDQRFCVWGDLLRNVQGAELSGGGGGEGGGGRVFDDEQALQHGGVARQGLSGSCGNAEMVRALSTIMKGYYDYGHFRAPIQIASIMGRCGMAISLCRISAKFMRSGGIFW